RPDFAVFVPTIGGTLKCFESALDGVLLYLYFTLYERLEPRLLLVDQIAAVLYSIYLNKEKDSCLAEEKENDTRLLPTSVRKS
ncbi:MAG: hypothetical protein ACLFRY_01775, partial [Spirochaetia bacterium]